MRSTLAKLAVSLLVGLACPLVGCLQIETRVLLNPDGSATVTERVQFSRQLLSLAEGEAATRPDGGLASLLEKKAVLARMARMGKGVELLSHQVRDAAGGARESLAVFKVADLNDFEYASPFLAYVDYPVNATVRCKCQPLYKSRSYAGSAGQMSVMFQLTRSPRGEEKPKEGEKLPPGPSPAQVQIMRELGPVFRDAMSDLRLRFSFESYAPIEECGFGYRGAREKSRVVDLLDFSADDLDKFIEQQRKDIAVAQGRPVLRGLSLYHGKRGSGLSVEFPIRHGPITCVGLTQTRDGRFKLVVAEGESLPGPIPPTGNTNTRCRFPPDVGTFIENWSLQGPTHHFALGVGHVAHLVESLARCWGIECVNVTRS